MIRPLILIAALLPQTLLAREVAEVGVDWVGNDIVIEAVADPDIPGVTCHLAYFSRSVIDRLSQGNWFEDPSNSAIECARTGPIDLTGVALDEDGDEVFRESRSLIFKSLRVRRVFDAESRVLIYLAHGSELTEGSAKMSIATVPLLPEDQAP